MTDLPPGHRSRLRPLRDLEFGEGADDRLSDVVQTFPLLGLGDVFPELEGEEQQCLDGDGWFVRWDRAVQTLSGGSGYVALVAATSRIRLRLDVLVMKWNDLNSGMSKWTLTDDEKEAGVTLDDLNRWMCEEVAEEVIGLRLQLTVFETCLDHFDRTGVAHPVPPRTKEPGMKRIKKGKWLYELRQALELTAASHDSEFMGTKSDLIANLNKVFGSKGQNRKGFSIGNLSARIVEDFISIYDVDFTVDTDKPAQKALAIVREKLSNNLG